MFFRSTIFAAGALSIRCWLRMSLAFLFTCLRCLLVFLSFVTISLYAFHCIYIGDLRLPFIFVIFLWWEIYVFICINFNFYIVTVFTVICNLGDHREFFCMSLFTSLLVTRYLWYPYRWHLILFSSITFNFRIFAISCSCVTSLTISREICFI